MSTMGTPTRLSKAPGTSATGAASDDDYDDIVPDTPESLTDVLERIKARSEAAGHPVTIDLPPRPSSLADAGDDDDDDDNSDRPPTPNASAPYDAGSARKLLVQAQRRTDRILQSDQPQTPRRVAATPELRRQQQLQLQQSPGIICSAGNWLFGSKIERRRKEGLRVQVEEQRRVLRRALRRQSDGNSSGNGGGGGSLGGGNDSGENGSQKHHHHHHHNHYQGEAATAGGMFAGGICSAISAAYSYEQSDDDDQASTTSSGRCSICSSATSTSQDDDDKVVEHPIDTGSGYHVNVHVPTPRAEDSEGGSGFDAAAADAPEGHDANASVGYDDEDLAMEVVVEAEDNNTRHILSAPQRKAVALNVLPPSVRYCRWRRLYSLARDGDSFEAFLRHVAGWKRTLLVLATSRGDVFGAYADSAWENQGHSLGATFYGSAQASLWRIQSSHTSDSGGGGVGDGCSPSSKVIVYKWTGANRYIQLCDPQAKLLALGGGGDDGEFGLCVENDFQRGSTGSCETFGNDPLCGQDRFDIVDLEFYGFPSGFA